MILNISNLKYYNAIAKSVIKSVNMEKYKIILQILKYT